MAESEAQPTTSAMAPVEAPASQVPASLSSPANLSSVASPGPDPAGTLPQAREEEDGDERDLIDYFEDFIDEVKGRQEAISSDTFVQKLQKSPYVGTRNELRDWVYGFLVKLAELDEGHAVAFVRLRERLDDAEDEIGRQGQLVRAMASNYLSMLALALAKLTLEGGEDSSKKSIAQEIVRVVSEIQAIAQQQMGDTKAVLDALQGQAAQEAAAPATGAAPAAG